MILYWLKSAEERVGSIEDPNTPIGKALAFFPFGEFGRTITGRPVNEGSALGLSAFYNGVAMIAGDIGTVPLKVYRRLDDGGRAEETGHSLWDLLTLSPFDMLTSAAWREASQGHLLLRGNCYSEIIANSRGVVTGLVPHNPNNVVRKGDMYEINGKRRVGASNMLHIAGPGGNGIDGYSVIQLARENIELGLALEESNTRFIANASRPSGFLSTPEPLSPEAALRLKKQWSSKNAGLENVGNIPVLDGGISWQQVGLNAEETQYIESRRFTVNDVARWLNIPPPKLKDLERATFSNIEELSIDYVRGTLRPWAVRWEQSLNTKLLTDRERRAGLFIAFNLDGLLRGDTEARAQSQRTYFEIGGLTTNEIRALENRNPIEGGDRAFIRMDMMPLDRVDEVQAVETDDEGRTRVVFRESRAREVRSHESRIALRAAFIGLFLDAALRMIRGEARNLRRILERGGPDFMRFIEAYYFDEHPEFAHRTMSPVFRSYAESVATAAAAEIDDEVGIDVVSFADEYTDTFVTRYSANSRRAFVGMQSTEEVEQRLQEWTEGTSQTAPRNQQIANREIVRLGDAVARTLWVAAGVRTFVWRTLRDSCPYCTRLNGKVVSRTTPFIVKGEEFEGEDTDVPLVPSSNVSHAPAHRGCDCTIVPGN